LDLPNEKVAHQPEDLLVVPIEVTVDVTVSKGVMMIVMMDVEDVTTTATTAMNVLVMMIAMHQAVVITTAVAGRIITMTHAVKKSLLTLIVS
jgi:hypothetical protein